MLSSLCIPSLATGIRVYFSADTKIVPGNSNFPRYGIFSIEKTCRREGRGGPKANGDNVFIRRLVNLGRTMTEITDGRQSGNAVVRANAALRSQSSVV